jgi:hypothetical protein
VVVRDVPREIDNAFFSGQRSENVRFCANDSVRINHGIGEAETGSVISIESLAPEVTYLIELSSGESTIVSQNSLDPLE